jgi:hypothetical protein
VSGPLPEGVVPLRAADDHLDGRDRPRSAWYLRSLGDHDTHRGELNQDGLVLAACGAVFMPRPTLKVVGPPPGELVAAGPALKGNPPDPEQVCQECGHGGGR